MPRTIQDVAPLPRAFFRRDALHCARALIGTELVHGECRGRVIETEAYRERGDPACHLFTRPSAREFADRCEPGAAYVYLNYGIHWLANVLCRDPETGEAGFVLFRALEPVAGLDRMAERRSTENARNFCSGPGKLAAALGIGRDHHGRALTEDPDFCLAAPVVDAAAPEIATDRRVGISAAKELEWRFLAKDHPGVSVKRGRVR